MRKIYLHFTILLSACIVNVSAESFTIITSGSNYSPASLNVVVGDEITIMASNTHPLLQVTEASWNVNGTTAEPGGFGPVTSAHTFTVTTAGAIYFVCTQHVGGGMKGMINVSVATGITPNQQTSNLEIYPNLVENGAFSIKGNKEQMSGSRLELYDMKGQLVKSVGIENETEDVNIPLSDGSYTGIITNNGKVLLRQRMIFVTID